MMNTRMLGALKMLLMLAAAITPSVVRAQPDRMIAAEDAAADAALARRAVELIHPGLTRYSSPSAVGQAFDMLADRCRGDLTEAAFYAELSRALGVIRCSHTKAEPSKAWDTWRKEQPTYLPFRFKLDGDRMVVIHSATDLLRPGDEVLAIGGRSAGAVIAQVLEMTPADGFTDQARRYSVSSASDLDDSEFDQFLPTLMPMADAARLEVRSPGEFAARAITVKLMSRDERRGAINIPTPAANLDEAVHLDLPRDGLAVLRVDTFVAYRKQIKPEQVYRPLFEKIAAENIQTLILDLRSNSGGSDSAAIDLARFLIGEPFTAKTRALVKTWQFGDLADKLETWDRSVLTLSQNDVSDTGDGFYELRRSAPQPQTPLEPTFRGRLIALCGPANQSGATLFLAGLRSRRPVTLIGESTGGAVDGPTAGIIVFLPLPASGIRVRIPVVRSVTEWTPRGTHGGVTPDVVVPTTAADLAAGVDPVLARAIELPATCPAPPAAPAPRPPK